MQRTVCTRCGSICGYDFEAEIFSCPECDKTKRIEKLAKNPDVIEAVKNNLSLDKIENCYTCEIKRTCVVAEDFSQSPTFARALQFISKMTCWIGHNKPK